MKEGCVAFLIMAIVLLFCPVGRAAGGACPLCVEPVFSADNIGSDGYHIEGRPGETAAFKAVLRNLTGHTIKLDFYALNAYSGEDGIFYERPDNVDAQTCSLVDERSGLAQYMSMADTIPLVAGMSAVLTVTVKIPEVEAGTLLGGFRIVVEDGDEPTQTVDTAIRIDLPSEAAPLVAAGDIGISDNWISIPVVNLAPAIAQNVSAAYEIRDEKGALLFEEDVILPEMAPLSRYNILCPAETMESDQDLYTLNMQLNAGGQSKAFVRTFTAAGPVQPEPDVRQSAGTNAGQPETDVGMLEDRKQAGPHATAEAYPAQGMAAATRDGLSPGVIHCVVWTIAAAFAGVLIWMRNKTRKRGRHERPLRWVAKDRNAA